MLYVIYLEVEFGNLFCYKVYLKNKVVKFLLFVYGMCIYYWKLLISYEC